jgi:hypothetical protein
MRALSTLLKWGLILLIVLLVPWLLLPLAVYIGWRFGIFRGLSETIKRVRKSLRIRDRLFKFNASNHEGLRLKTVGCNCCISCDDSPFALIPDLSWFRCVSALVVSDNSGTMDNYKNAIDEAMRFLSNSYSTVILTLDISAGTIGCKIQVSEPCFDRSEGWLQRLGDNVSDRGWALENAIQSLSPSLRVRVCRGEEILQTPLMEEGRRGYAGTK